MAVFLTGATGFLGRRLLKALLARGQEVVPLVRARDVNEARARLSKVLGSLGRADPAWSAALRPCVGSLDRPGLGLDATDREHIMSHCDAFLHCGANVRFDLPLATARQVNVDGTRAVLELARRRQEQKGISRFDHVSTAFVAGRRTDVVLEAELEAPLGHKNSYEASKFEGEKLVRSHMPELPIAIFRPSIVVGAAADGSTTSFNVIYWPIRVYSKGLWRICPGHPQTPIDLVPVDFVSDAITSLRELPESIGKCFHLAAGADGAERLGDLTELVRRFFAVKHPVVFVNPGPWMRWVHPVLKHLTFGPPRRVVRSGEVYVPYFCGNPLFDTTNTRELLASTEVSVPRVSDYLERLFKYCVDTDWGRAPLEPREIAGQTPAQ